MNFGLAKHKVSVIIPNGLWVVHNVLSPQKCEELIAISEKVGYHKLFSTLPDRVKYPNFGMLLQFINQ